MTPRRRPQEHWFHRWKRPWRKPVAYQSAAILTAGGRGTEPYPAWSLPDGVELLHDPSPARWVEESLSKYPWATVGDLVPDVYESYVRILHPAYRGRGSPEREPEPVRWAEVAEMTGRTLHPLAQFARLAGIEDLNGQLEWGQRPREGELPREVAEPLLRVLGEFTTTPGDCLFCVWSGWGDLFALEGYDEDSYRHVKTPGREYLLLKGALQRIPKVGLMGWEDPSIWWPDDHAWCVATEIDLDSTYVGGSTECIARLVDDPELETMPASLEDRVDFGSDTVNV